MLFYPIELPYEITCDADDARVNEAGRLALNCFSNEKRSRRLRRTIGHEYWRFMTLSWPRKTPVS